MGQLFGFGDLLRAILGPFGLFRMGNGYLGLAKVIGNRCGPVCDPEVIRVKRAGSAEEKKHDQQA